MKPQFQNSALNRRALRVAGAAARVSGVWLVAFVILGGAGASDGAAVRAEQPERPSFIRHAPGTVLPVRVREIVSTEVADLVMIPAGFNSGYRPGMICRVFRDELEVAEIMMVEVRNEVSAGVIVNLFTDEVIERGDVIRVKTTQYQR